MLLLQATDSIVDFAVGTKKPFALVPCCVFPRLFPHRRMPRADASGLAQDSSALAPTPNSLHQSPYQDGLTQATHEQDKLGMVWKGHTDVDASSTEPYSEAEEPGADGIADMAGAAVVSIEQLLVYLQHKGSPSTHVECLPFEGMNQTVYRLPG